MYHLSKIANSQIARYYYYRTIVSMCHDKYDIHAHIHVRTTTYILFGTRFWRWTQNPIFCCNFYFYEAQNEFFVYFYRARSSHWRNIKMNNVELERTFYVWCHCKIIFFSNGLNSCHFKPFSSNGSHISFGRINKSCELYDCAASVLEYCCFGQMTAKCYHTQKNAWLPIGRKDESNGHL